MVILSTSQEGKEYSRGLSRGVGKLARLTYAEQYRMSKSPTTPIYPGRSQSTIEAMEMRHAHDPPKGQCLDGDKMTVGVLETHQTGVL